MADPKDGERGGEEPTVDAFLWHCLLISNPYATQISPILSHVRGMAPDTRIEKSHSGRARILPVPWPLMGDSTLKSLLQERSLGADDPD
jgi:hypothetical protein